MTRGRLLLIGALVVALLALSAGTAAAQTNSTQVPDTVDRFSEGDIWGVLADSYGGAMPLPLLTGATGSLVLVSLYINSRSVSLVAITAMVSGGAIIGFMPPEVRMGGYLLLAAGAAAVGVGLWQGQRRPVRR